jgi:signal transduction histidine kinase
VAESQPRRRTALRVRITAVATLAVAVALLAGAALFGVVLRVALVDAAAASASAYADDIAARVDAAGARSLDDDDPDDRFFRVLDDDGAVLAASEDAAGVTGASARAGDDHGTVAFDGADHVLAVADTDDGVVVAGQSLDDVDDTFSTVVGLLLVAVPLVVALVAATTWIVVGRALRPVDRMRREVDEVTASRLDRRVAETGTSDEIGRLATTMNRMLDRLDESQSVQRRFVSDASHELRSPLASLRQFAEVARAHPDRVGAAELSDAILDEGARLERLVEGMLTLARADEGALGQQGRLVDLDDIVLAEVRRLRAFSGLTVDATSVGPARVVGDPALLHGLVRNLVDNAARHAVGVVRVELDGGGREVLLAVEDDGDGVPEADRQRVFDRFVRLDEARARESGGSGLGLAIVREIVLAHRGSVVLASGRLGGARVEVRLPAAADD